MTGEEDREFAKKVFEAAAREGNVRVKASLHEVRALLGEANKIAVEHPQGWGGLLGRFTEEINGERLVKLLARINRKIANREVGTEIYGLIIFGHEREVWMVSAWDSHTRSATDLIGDPANAAALQRPADGENAGAKYSDAEGGL